MSAPGFYHGPIDGHASAGSAIVTDHGAQIPVSLGTIAGRDISFETGDLSWLADLEHAVRDARARLSMLVCIPVVGDAA
jgi:hypothetical protein